MENLIFKSQLNLSDTVYTYEYNVQYVLQNRRYLCSFLHFYKMGRSVIEAFFTSWANE
jgi:hypothetical protein